MSDAQPKQRPTPETDAMFTAFNQRLPGAQDPADFVRNLERQRDEALESKGRISQRAEAIRRELVEKDKQIEAMRKTLIESEAYQAGLVADIEDMRVAIKEAHAVLEDWQLFWKENAGHSSHMTWRDGRALEQPTSTALAKLQPLIQPNP